MKIAHIGLACFYTEGMTYQDNLLSEQNVRDGHQVLYISNAAKYVDGKIVETGYEDTVLSSGVHLVRLPYVKVLNHFVSEKFRKVKGLYQLLEDFAPDVILSHDLCYWSVRDVIRYKKGHPEVKFYADTHTAQDNSGTNWLSLHILHRGLYKCLTHKALPYLEKYLYIGEGEREFSAENYDVPESIMEFYPLGGELPLEEDASRWRSERRNELDVGEGTLLFVHAGKLEPKKKTEMLLKAFAAAPELDARLAVIGSIPKDDEERLLSLMRQDARVRYLGWMSGGQLQQYLCACDLYVQPGKVSAIMQNAVCCGCPVLSYPHEAYTNRYDYGNFIWSKTEEELVSIFKGLAQGQYDLPAMRKGSEACARELLDYKALAARLYR